MIRFASSLLLLSIAFPALAAMDGNMHAGELAHQLDRLSRTGRVLYVAAHPDDENTRLLAYLANAEHLEVAYLSLTRGGGGQNLIGAEKGVLLDVIRTEELLAARRIDGARQFFTNARDYGYSKRLEEALEIWGLEQVLSDVVWVIRAFQPDVIITRFDETPPNHGHHMASARLARLAFDAAADPRRFPEHFEAGARPWKAERLLHNLAPWRTEKLPEDAISVDVGGYDPRLGRSYGEIAAVSRSQHKSQGFGAAGTRGSQLEHFVWVAGSRPAQGLFDGIDLGWGRYGEAARPYVEALDHARAALDRDHPERALVALAEARAALAKLPDDVRVREARVRLEEVMAAAAGLFVRATAERPAVAPGEKVKVEVEVVLRRPARAVLEEIDFPGGEVLEIEETLAENHKRTFEAVVPVAPGAAISVPSWLREAPTEGRFLGSTLREIGRPKDAPALAVRAVFSIEGRRVELVRPVVFSFVDRVHGERIEEVRIAPPATLTPTREAILVSYGEPRTLTLAVRAAVERLRATIRLEAPEGWEIAPRELHVELEGVGAERLVHFQVAARPGASAFELRPRIEVEGRSYAYRQDRIDHPHIPPQTLYRPATVRLVPAELEIPVGLVGYVPGAGDTIAEDLAHLGIRVETLDAQALRSGDLDRYDAIVVGVRAYNTRDDLRGAHERLMEYVRRGGTLLVQYIVSNRWTPFDESIGPYELRIGPDRVTDETARMEFVDPAHPALHRPHRITEADFEGWVQERGLYFASKWSPEYQPLFSCRDPGEEPLLGSTLVARHGKGRFVYTGLSFFRQLPAGVPGAYRLFLNLLAREEDGRSDDQAAR